MEYKILPGGRASLDRHDTWRALRPSGRGKTDKMSIIPPSPNPFVRGLVSKAGVETMLTSPATHKTSPLLNTPCGLIRCSTPRGQDYSVALYGTGISGHGKICRPEKRRKKTPATQKSMTGEVLLHAHQLGTLVVSNPNLLRSGIADTEIEAFKEI